VVCAECGRRAKRGELWRLLFADIGEVAIYCPECAEREPSHEFPDEMHSGDTFTYDGWTWQVTQVAAKQFDAEGEPELTLRCIVV
jgi:hypothetical protein